ESGPLFHRRRSGQGISIPTVGVWAISTFAISIRRELACRIVGRLLSAPTGETRRVKGPWHARQWQGRRESLPDSPTRVERPSYLSAPFRIHRDHFSAITTDLRNLANGTCPNEHRHPAALGGTGPPQKHGSEMNWPPRVHVSPNRSRRLQPGTNLA